MNKFRKILLLVLSVVLVLTALTVTALATSEQPGESKHVFDWSDGNITEVSKSKIGKFQIAEGDDGNKYAEFHSYDPDCTSPANGSGTYLELLSKTGNKSYSVGAYPYAVLDFHIKKETSNWPGFSISISPYSSGGAARVSTEARLYKNGIDGYNTFTNMLPKTIGEWAHVSVVTYGYYDESADRVRYTNSIYVNGEFACSQSYVTSDTYTGDNRYDSYVSLYRFLARTYTPAEYTEAGNRIAGFDNFNISYLKSFDSSDSVAKYIYESRGKNLPYGNTVAQVGEQKFDNISKALDYAYESGEALELAANVSDAILITKPVTIKKGEFTAELLHVNGLKMTEEGTTVVFAEYTDYDLALLHKDGSVEGYYTAADYSAVFTKAMAESGSTIMLNKDIQVSDQIHLLASTNVTLDLNGYTLKRFNEYGTTYTKDETGEYVAGEKTTVNKNAFYVKSLNDKGSTTTTSGVHFTITSSRDGGRFLNVAMKKDLYYETDGTFVEAKAGSLSGGTLLRATAIKDSSFTLSNVEVQSASIVYTDWGSTNNFDINVDNVNYYRTLGSEEGVWGYYPFFIGTNNVVRVNAKDSLFVDTGVSTKEAYFIRTDESGNDSVFTFDNCDLISLYKSSAIWGSTAISGASAILVDESAKNVKFDFINSRIYNLYNSKAENLATLGNGTLTTGIYDNSYLNRYVVEKGYVLAPKSVTVDSYMIPDSGRFTVNAETGEINDITFTETSYTFTKQVSPCSEVEGSIPDAKLSMIYTTGFKMVLYVPVMDGRTVTVPSGFVKAAEDVLINGVAHHAYEKELTTTGAGDTVTVKLSYTVDGVSFRQDFYISALVYADIVLADQNAVAEEKLAVGNMVRYIKEARLASSLTASSQYTDLITKSGIEDYKELYTDEATIENVSAYVESINFVITNGIASYKIVLADASCADQLVVSIDGKTLNTTVGTEDVIVEEETVTKTYLIVESARVYDIINTVTLTVGEVSGTYSILENIEGVEAAEGDANLLKALYEFGIAAKAYREILEAQA